MYTATIYDIVDRTKPPTKLYSEFQTLVELKVGWYCFKTYPIRTTWYDMEDGQFDVGVYTSGKMVAGINFEETPSVQRNTGLVTQ
jgi:hypothetical protein